MCDEYRFYFEQLLTRMNSAVKVPFREVRFDGWEPRISDCHSNVDLWVHHHPETKPVRGWLFWPPNAAGQYTIMAHSVLEEDGQLVDITPLQRDISRDGLLFLKQLGTEADFLAMKAAYSQVFFP